MSLPEADTALFFLVNKGIQNGVFDLVMPFVTKQARLLILPLAVFILLKERKEAVMVLFAALAALAFSDGCCHVIKDLVGRQRPCAALEGVRLLVGCGRSFSFPSSHAANSFAVVGAFWVLRRGMITSAFFVLAAAVAFSRVYVGVHYPSDVAAGIIVGAGAAAFAVFLSKQAISVYRDGLYERGLLLVLLLVSLFRVYFIITGPYDLSPDEAHYWEWSRRPDWSYYSKGPMIASLISAGTSIFGNTVLGVRIFAVLLSALSSLILFRLGRELFDEKTGVAAALVMQAVPLYSVFGVIMTIDAPFIFFWVLALYFFRKAVVTGQSPEAQAKVNHYWLMTGAAVGLGILAKYTMSLFFFCGFLYLLAARDRRRLLLRGGPYVSLLSGALLSSPIIIWNAAHGWVTFRHTAGQVHVSEGVKMSLGDLMDFLLSQFGVITPLLLVMVFLALWKVRREEEGEFLLWFSVPVILFFLLKSAQAKVQANWALPGYAGGFLAFSAVWVRGFSSRTKGVKAAVVASVLLAFAVTAVAHYPSPLHLPPDKDPTRRLLGWKELGMKVSEVSRELSSAGPFFIFSDKYQVASELAFYVKGNPVTYCANLGRRMNQYDLWPGFEGLIGHNAVFVVSGERSLPPVVAAAFGRHEAEVVNLEANSAKIMKFTVFKCYDFKGMKTKPAEKF